MRKKICKIRKCIETVVKGKTLGIVLLLTLVILAGTPKSFATPQYLTNLTAVYGNGYSCPACHAMPLGNRGPNETFGNRTGMMYNRTGTVNRTGMMYNRTGMVNRTGMMYNMNSYGTLFENQPNHAADPSTALMTIGRPPTTQIVVTVTPQVTSTPQETVSTTGKVVMTGTRATPGFGIVVSLVGLFACAILIRRYNKRL